MMDLNMVNEYCPFCESEVEIPFDKVSKCPNCGREIFPCADCDEPGCNWNGETFSCHSFTHSMEEIELLKAEREVLLANQQKEIKKYYPVNTGNYYSWSWR